MAECDYCGEEVVNPFTCNYCGETFCSKHKLPPNHDCPNIGAWESRSGPTIGAHEKLRSWKAGGKLPGKKPSPIKPESSKETQNTSYFESEKTLKKLGGLGKRVGKGIVWFLVSFIPLIVGLGFIYFMIPEYFKSLTLPTMEKLSTLASTFLFPLFTGNLLFHSYVPWVACIVSGFVGGLIYRDIILPLILTFVLAWILAYFWGGLDFFGLTFFSSSYMMRKIILNQIVAILTFCFGAAWGTRIKS